MKNRKRMILVWTISLILAMSAAGCSSGKEDSSGSGVGRQETGNALKSFEAETLDGDAFTQADLAEKDVTIINFWSVLCGPCIEEMPDIAEFEKTVPENIGVITVCLDGSIDTESVKNILKDAGYEGTTLLTGTGDFQKICENIQYTPTTIVVDKEGNIVGEEIIGRQKDLETTYTDAVNDVLRKMGKEEIGDGKE